MILETGDEGVGSPVVLLHARPADRRQWTAVSAVLAAAGHRVIAPDLAGFGASPVDATAPSAPWRDVTDTLDAVGVARALLVGNSLGAQTALQVAVTAPERVSGLVLMGYRRHDQPASPRLRDAWAAERRALDADDLDAAVDAGLNAWLSPWSGRGPRQVLAAALRRDLLRRSDDPAPRLEDDPLDDDSWAERVVAPAVILHGADDMPDFAIGAERLRVALGAGEIETVADAAHLVPLEQPAAVAAAVLRLLAATDRVADRPLTEE
ncbi:alpha/beta fold hydrolase [Amnibacterium setariae]|uniref:Alpha/beta hydrolase n=1 Tax=Amnibacterium setariae TaxID=2306585 RepID=A0A3A1TXS7_9MICO|nr:alpha/beta hydrolase [Amnibacterium setariae]RIX28619.1 alpha/beta hydrolase [Amnibacterium setariae]